MIQTFIAIAKSALDETDFIGQEDELNYIIVTNRYNEEKLASFLTFAFDTVVPKFYSEKDAQRGYMILKGSHYAGMRVNFVSLLIGGIIDDFEKISSPEILLNKLRDVKNMAKIPSGSNYIIERKKLSASDSISQMGLSQKIYIKEKDDSLRYLIRTALELQGYDVQVELDFESAKQPTIMIIDSGEDLAGLEFLRELKKNQH